MAARTIQEGREALRTIRQRLLYPSPEAISACLPDLDRAVACLSALGNNLVPVEGLRDELKRFKQEVREANALLRRAADYYLDCLALLSAGRGEYAPSGDIVGGLSASSATRIALEG